MVRSDLHRSILVIAVLSGFIATAVVHTSSASADAGPGPFVLLDQPQRILNSTPVQPGADQCFAVVGGGIPADAAGVMLNVTAAGQGGPGWLTVYPAGQQLPATSTLNFDVSEYAIANGAIARVGRNGQVCVDAGQYSANLILDVTGY